MAHTQEEVNKLKSKIDNLKYEIEVDKLTIEEDEVMLENLCQEILSYFEQVYPEIHLEVDEISEINVYSTEESLNSGSILEDYLLKFETRESKERNLVKLEEEKKNNKDEEELKYFLESGIFEVLEDLSRKTIEKLDWEKARNVYKDLRNKFKNTFHKKPNKFPKEDEICLNINELDDYSQVYTWSKEEIPKSLEQEEYIRFSVIKKGWKVGDKVLILARLKFLGLRKDYEPENFESKKYDTEIIDKEIILPKNSSTGEIPTSDLNKKYSEKKQSNWFGISTKTVKKLSKIGAIDKDKLRQLKVIRERMYTIEDLIETLKEMSFLDNEIDMVLRYANSQ